MEFVITGLVAGVLGTIAMDLSNLVFARIGLLSRIDLRMLGMMAAGWAHGRFRYGHPSEMRPVEHAVLYGCLAHYAIGVGFALLYVIGWELLAGGPASPGWAIAFGFATTVASYFLVLPSMGLGVFGRRSPEGAKPALSSLVNHLFYGLGIAAGIALV